MNKQENKMQAKGDRIEGEPALEVEPQVIQDDGSENPRELPNSWGRDGLIAEVKDRQDSKERALGLKALIESGIDTSSMSEKEREAEIKRLGREAQQFIGAERMREQEESVAAHKRWEQSERVRIQAEKQQAEEDKRPINRIKRFFGFK